MTAKNVQVLIAFESVRPGERVEIRTEDSDYPIVGHVIEKSPAGYYDTGWCIKIKAERVGIQWVKEEGFWEIFRKGISSLKFLPEDGEMQLQLPFDDDQLPLGIQGPPLFKRLFFSLLITHYVLGFR